MSIVTVLDQCCYDYLRNVILQLEKFATINCIASGLGRSLAVVLLTVVIFITKLYLRSSMHTSFYFMYVRFEDFASVAFKVRKDQVTSSNFAK